MTLEKGAMIFHMLRWEIGDKAFLATLKGALSQYTDKPIRTADFDKVAEAQSQQQLTPFFAQWVDGTGAPHFTNKYAVYRLGNNKGFRTIGEIDQDLDLFRMPVDLRVETDGKTETKKVDVVGTDSQYVVDTFGRPRRITIDPGDWVLKSTPDLQVRIAILKGQQLVAQGDLTGALAEYQKALARQSAKLAGQLPHRRSALHAAQLPGRVNSYRDALRGDGEPRWTEVWSHIAARQDLRHHRPARSRRQRIPPRRPDQRQHPGRRQRGPPVSAATLQARRIRLARLDRRNISDGPTHSHHRSISCNQKPPLRYDCSATPMASSRKKHGDSEAGTPAPPPSAHHDAFEGDYRPSSAATFANTPARVDPVQLDYLLQLADALNTTLDLQTLLNRTAELVRAVIDYRIFAILLLNDRTNDLRMRFQIGHTPEVERMRIRIGKGVVGEAAQRARPSWSTTSPRPPTTSPPIPTCALSSPCRSSPRTASSASWISNRTGRLLPPRTPAPAHAHRFAHRPGHRERAPLHPRLPPGADPHSPQRDRRELTSILDLDPLLAKIGQLLRRLIDYQMFTIMLLDDKGQRTRDPLLLALRRTHSLRAPHSAPRTRRRRRPRARSSTSPTCARIRATSW